MDDFHDFLQSWFIAFIYRFLTFSPLIIITNNTNVNRYLVILLSLSLFSRFDRNTFERIVVESGMAKRLVASESSFHDFMTGVATVESLNSFSHSRFTNFVARLTFNIGKTVDCEIFIINHHFVIPSLKKIPLRFESRKINFYFFLFFFFFNKKKNIIFITHSNRVKLV